MSTNLKLQPIIGMLVTRLDGVAPAREVVVTSATKDEAFSSDCIQVAHTYAHGKTGTITIPFDDIDMVVDALLEHQAAREGHQDDAILVGEVEVWRAKLRREFMERRHGDE